MALHGHSLIAGSFVEGEDGSMRAVDPATNSELDPAYSLLSVSQLQTATQAATDASDWYRGTDPEKRARLLEAIADNIEAMADEITERGVAETGLPPARLHGERGRTTGQLRLFAGVVREGDHLEVRIDPAQPDRKPLPAPDLRSRQVPLGPVAVFGASNFPLAFSTAGGDTASALAAGCPVIVKGHNAHPGTAELVGQAITAAVSAAGLPAGVFSLVFGAGNAIGQALVADPRVKAVGFTGSRAGGLALVRAAAERAEPIPVHAEMSSTNPVFMLPGALTGNPSSLAEAFVGSLTMGAGQFCTNPGVLFVPSGPDGDAFLTAASEAVETATGASMLTPGIAEAFASGVDRFRQQPGADVSATGSAGDGANAPGPIVLSTTLDYFRRSEELQNEIFGAASLIVRYDDPTELARVVGALEGQLTATVHAGSDDREAAVRLVRALELKVGRIIFDGWPTGVEVGHAMVHGGPFPATSESRFTSVGSQAIYRFQRPVAYQDMPEELLPDAVAEGNPWRLNRRINGRIELA
ncbi:MAG: aldehyde dehydrogenase (NADP(+)) [Microlunatus sp.]|nr:aldehyde dehydrogenase (NADP(+)) [Microlunatus sp.]MDN5770721.1 aldehyde dehydrogenase (NADP(+)) [Microlunatus sp.]